MQQKKSVATNNPLQRAKPLMQKRAENSRKSIVNKSVALPQTPYQRYINWISRFKVWGSEYLIPVSVLLVGIGVAGLLNGVPLFILFGVPLRIWCLYLVTCWWIFCLASIGVHVIPNILTLFFGDAIQNRLDYYRYMQNYAAFVVVSVAADNLWDPFVVENTVEPREAQAIWQETINKLLTVMTIMSISLGIEKTFLQMVGVNFHRTTYQDRIKKSKADIDVLERLFNATKGRQELERSGTSAGESSQYPISAADRRKLNLKNLKSALESATTTLGSIASEIFDVQATDAARLLEGNVSSTKCETVKSMLLTIQGARMLARRIYNGICPEGKKQIVLDDFLALGCFASKEDAERAFDVFDADGNGDLSRNEMRSAISKIYRERKAIVDSLRDLDHAVGKLDNILKVFVYSLVAFVGASYFDIDVATLLATAGSVILGLSFMVGSTAQAIFESCIFLFVQ